MARLSVRKISLILTLVLNAHVCGADDVKVNWKLTQKRIAQAHISPNFIHQLKNMYHPENLTEVVELNTLLFLRKEDYHGTQVTPDAVRDVRQFVAAHRVVFADAEVRFGVPREVVASLLWLESRYGQNPGRFHIASVFLDLLQCDRPEVLRHLEKAALRYKRRLTKKDRLAIHDRARKRVRWALQELKALQAMSQQSPQLVAQLNGSFAGAFGMPQFEPSSYVQYAQARKDHAHANLELAEDAIFSVSHFLHGNGWRVAVKTHARALYRYNKSADYGAAILKLADQARLVEHP